MNDEVTGDWIPEWNVQLLEATALLPNPLNEGDPEYVIDGIFFIL